MEDLSSDLSALSIRVADPTRPEALALIEASRDAMPGLDPPEEIFTPGPDTLAAPNVQFLIAWQAQRGLGCAALVDAMEYGLIQRLYVRPEARGLGIGRALLTAVDALARDLGLPALRLETCNALVAATQLYEAMGYQPCPAFGDMPDLEQTLFMEKRLL